MARIVPKLNLNRTPEIVDNNSLIFAKNVRLNANGLSADYGFEDISVFATMHNGQAHSAPILSNEEQIVGVIPYNTSFFVLLYIPSHTDVSSGNLIDACSKIVEYNEETGWRVCNCNWNWSGGKKIDGTVSINLNGDTILTIAEYDTPDGVWVPLKVINLNESHGPEDPNGANPDDESIYTQAPKVPFININCTERYKNSIPAGVYQFFVRYEIRKDFYTNWFPASKELFAGYKTHMLTNQGELTFAKSLQNQMADSDDSFILDIEHLIDVEGYKSFQLGFILSHDTEVYARAYKHYDLYTSRIYFDYDTEYIEEIDIKEILDPVYSLYNVGNVTNYKNKLYISNYTESDFNPNEKDVKEFVDNISISLSTETEASAISTFCGNTATIEQIELGGSTINFLTKVVIDEETLTIGNIVRNFVGLHETTIKLGNNISIKYKGINCKIKSYKYVLSPDDPSIPGGGEVIVVDDPLIINPVVHNYSISGTNINGTNLTSVLNAYLGENGENILGVKLSNGKVIKTDGNILSFTITFVNYNREEQKYYNVSVDLNFDIFLGDLNYNTVYKNEYTLIPYQGYDFYVHFVRSNGEITNGRKINEESIIVQEETFTNNIPPAIYPVFTFGKALPEGYIACFISFVHSKYKIAHIFNIHKLYAVGSLNTEDVFVGDCLELDTQLYSALDNIETVVTVNNVLKQYLIDYKASYDNTNLVTFGSSGKCIFKTDESNTITISENSVTPNHAFIRIRYDINDKYIQLTKCTPFILIPSDIDIDENPSNIYTYDDYKTLNLGGYLCKVSKLKDNINYYVSGTDIYSKTNNTNSDTGVTINLEPLPNTAAPQDSSISDQDNNTINWGSYHTSSKHIIYSNFNLNYITLHNSITPRLVTKVIPDNDADADNDEKRSYLTLLTDSIQLSEIYELKSEYYNYTKRLYLPFDDYSIIKFDNTIRSSILEGDESKINIYKFNSTDYYNVPTDKGKIINLVAVGDNILVHTQDSIYKFSGQNSLTAAGGEDVQMKESEVFDTGIQELFGSEYGYAGLASKEHQILSEFGYTFWDKDSGRIYLYTGNAQVKVLSDDISKLLRRAIVTNIHLADDYYNNRIFFCIDFEDNTTATLSYDFVAKSFISLHDFKFDWAFKTKTRCYFLYKPDEVYNTIYRVGTTIGDYQHLEYDDTIYNLPTNNKKCIVDVIFNDRYEAIKTLNAISWVCNKVLGFDTSLNMAEENFVNNYTDNPDFEKPENRYKGDYLRLYTDSCCTDIIDLALRSNDSRLTDVDSYKQPRYNLGKWTLNYFRNILHRKTEPTAPRMLGEEDTLIYGKYIVARFVFNRTTNFKFEDVTFVTSNDYNV